MRADGELALDVATPHGMVRVPFEVAGRRRQLVRLHLADILHLEYDQESGELAVQAKARWLWSRGGGARGWASWVDGWLRAVHNLAYGRMAPFSAATWTVTGLELCADFTHLELHAEDAARIVGARKSSAIRHHVEVEGRVETVQVGTRASPVSVVMYDKDAELAAARKEDYYAERHRAHGWDGISNRARVELRLSGHGLTWTRQRREDGAWAQSGEILDARDPWGLTQRVISELWTHVTSSRRLVIPTDSRRRRAPTDPRWLVVQSAALEHDEAEDGWTWRQTRAVTDATWAHREERARRTAGRSLATLAILRGWTPDADTIVPELTAWAAELAQDAVEQTTDDGLARETASGLLPWARDYIAQTQLLREAIATQAAELRAWRDGLMCRHEQREDELPPALPQVAGAEPEPVPAGGPQQDERPVQGRATRPVR